MASLGCQQVNMKGFCLLTKFARERVCCARTDVCLMFEEHGINFEWDSTRMLDVLKKPMIWGEGHFGVPHGQDHRDRGPGASGDGSPP